MKRLGICLKIFILVFLSFQKPVMTFAESSPAFVAYANTPTAPFQQHRQIIRTSSGSIYYFIGNVRQNGFLFGWVDVYTSTTGNTWNLVSSANEWPAYRRDAFFTREHRTQTAELILK